MKYSPIYSDAYASDRKWLLSIANNLTFKRLLPDTRSQSEAVCGSRSGCGVIYSHESPGTPCSLQPRAALRVAARFYCQVSSSSSRQEPKGPSMTAPPGFSAIHKSVMGGSCFSMNRLISTISCTDRTRRPDMATQSTTGADRSPPPHTDLWTGTVRQTSIRLEGDVGRIYESFHLLCRLAAKR